MIEAEAATLFRRRYYINGSHAGYILYISEDQFSEADADALQEAVSQSKGPGNFRDLFLHLEQLLELDAGSFPRFW